MTTLKAELQKATEDWEKDCKTSNTGRRLQAPTPSVDCDALKAAKDQKEQEVSDLETQTKNLSCWKAPEEPVEPVEPTCEETLAQNEQNMTTLKAELQKATEDWEKDCKTSNTGRRLQAPTPSVDCDALKAAKDQKEQEVSDLDTQTKNLSCWKAPEEPEKPDCDKVGKELCNIDHELVGLYNAKFGLRRLSKSNRCPTRRQLQSVTSLTLNPDDEGDKKILDLLEVRKKLLNDKAVCVDQNDDSNNNNSKRLLRLFKRNDM